jgi:hypothetical protein
MLHAVRACALLITGNQEGRDVLRRHRSRFDNGKRWVDLNVVRAHALMFLDRTEEARALYEEFRELRNYMALSGIELIVNHFGMMRAAGLIHPLMHEIHS